MDIEKLKELKSWVSDLRKFGVSEGNEVITVLDEAIARQSVKSEEVAEAIERLEYWRKNKYKWEVKYVPCGKTIDLAIKALQAYQPTTRKDRIVEEAAISKTETTSCEWCDNADEMEVNVKTVSDSGKWVGIKRFSLSKSKFCPNCGKELVK